ncbi:MAG: hypothetical protein EPN39_14220 [Chitinophagaceae bacterium]|nr:MAG: hypothetical protein EPN39_14220 [Chitinophagaceae bacterium]
MLPILAVIAGVAASAFTTANSSYKTNSNAAAYYWFDPSNLTYNDLNTVSGEESITGCQSSVTSDCEHGFTQDQLVNPNDPSQGVKSGAQPAAKIYVRP